MKWKNAARYLLPMGLVTLVAWRLAKYAWVSIQVWGRGLFRQPKDWQDLQNRQFTTAVVPVASEQQT